MGPFLASKGSRRCSTFPSAPTCERLGVAWTMGRHQRRHQAWLRNLGQQIVSWKRGAPSLPRISSAPPHFHSANLACYSTRKVTRADMVHSSFLHTPKAWVMANEGSHRSEKLKSNFSANALFASTESTLAPNTFKRQTAVEKYGRTGAEIVEQAALCRIHHKIEGGTQLIKAWDHQLRYYSCNHVRTRRAATRTVYPLASKSRFISVKARPSAVQPPVSAFG